MKKTKLVKAIKVDQEVYDVVRDMQLSLEQWGLKQATLGESLKVLLAHRQPGGWAYMVERARTNRGWVNGDGS